MSTPALTTLAAAALLLAACSDPEGQQSDELAGFSVELIDGALRIARSDGTVLLGGVPADGKSSAGLPAALGWRSAKVDVTNLFGSFLFDEHAPDWSAAPRLELVSRQQGKLTLRAGAATGQIEAVKPGVLRVTWSAPAKANRLAQSFVCAASDRFFGLGSLVHGTQHRGEVVPLWTSEQGIGKLRRQAHGAGFPINGDVHDSYHPVPFLLTSRGVGLLLENSRRSKFHLCAKAAPGRWAVEAWHGKLQYLVIDGPRLTQVIERLTSVTGRPRLLPKWAFGPWMDAVHGQAKVLAAAKRLRSEKIPATAIWTEDWVGGETKLDGYHLKYQWSADTTLYPDLKGLASKLHSQGFRFLGYFNPFLEEGYAPYKEALQKGYAIKDAEGKVVTFSGVFFKKTTLPDLTDKQVVAWLQAHLKAAVDLGFDGWMADYAEWLPVNARLSDGRDGWEAHNQYPLMWQQAHRQVWDKARPSGDYVFFVRSGWAGTGGLAPVVWAGDQQTEFGGLDGMQSVIPIAVNLGLSGIPLVTHDIGGYSTVKVPARTKELFYRWAALAAYSTVMRTHHGASATKNWQWDHDAATLAYFRKLARIHVDLFPYRYTLAKQAADRGLPVMRHLVLHYAADPQVASIKDQFMLGPSLLVAPVQQDKARSREVYLPLLPAGSWYDHASGARLAGGKRHTVQASLEQIPVFAPAGAMIPTFLTAVDTLDQVTDAKLKGIVEAEAGPLGLAVYLGADGALTLYDGAALTLQSKGTPTKAPTIKVDGKAWPACAGGKTEACVQTLGSSALVVHLGPVTAFKIEGDGGLSLELKGAPAARKFSVTLRW